jgi:hypothetical protein
VAGAQIAGRIDHCDCRGRIPLLRALPRCLQDRLGSGLIEGPDKQKIVANIPTLIPSFVMAG